MRGFDGGNLGLLLCEAFLEDGSGESRLSACTAILVLERTRILFSAPSGDRTGDG